MIKFSTIIVTLSLIICQSQAWLTPTTRRTSDLRLTGPHSDEVIRTAAHVSTPMECSRRVWFSTLAVTAAATFPAHAATTTSTSPVVTTRNTCDMSVSVWKQPSTGRKVYIVGTAHISSSSAMLAGDLIDDVRPDGVFVELDAKRVRLQPNNQVLANGGSGAAAAPKGGIPLSAPADKVTSFIPNQPPVSSTTAPVRTGGIGSNLGAAALGSAIRGMYGKMSQSGFQPGQEFVLAVQEGQKVGATIILGDRDVEVTLRRLSEALRQTDLQKLLNPNNELETTMRELLPDGPAPTLDKSEDENFNAQLSAYVETIKTKENVRKIMQQLQAIAPEIYQAMVAERDAYMANGLDKLQQFPVIVAVMGMAHVFGVEDYLKGQGWEQVKLNCNQYRR